MPPEAVEPDQAQRGDNTRVAARQDLVDQGEQHAAAG
jgi:hypothetical protein